MARTHHADGIRPAIPSGIQGDDVSGYQTGIDWSRVAADGGQFSYAKATEGLGYTNPEFANEYDGAYSAGLIRGAYHFALPDVSSGAAQADYFVDNGGGWSADHQALPGMLDLEADPYGSECYGLSQSQMVGWINDFVTEYQARAGRDPVFYTGYYWWQDCTGNTNAFVNIDPLWIASYGTDSPMIPGGWGYYTFWQYADSGVLPGDQDVFSGDHSRLLALADNTP